MTRKTDRAFMHVVEKPAPKKWPKKKAPHPRDPDRPRVYTTPEAAEFLRCSTKTVKNYIKGGQLHPSKIGTRYLFSEEELKRLLEEGTNAEYSAYIRAFKSGGAALDPYRRDSTPHPFSREQPKRVITRATAEAVAALVAESAGDMGRLRDSIDRLLNGGNTTEEGEE